MQQEFTALALILATLCVCLGLGHAVLRLGSRPAQAATAGLADFHSTRYFSGLDGLRAVSVVAVIWAHTTGPHQLALLNHGHRGVDLFFAISGFLVTTLLLREYRAKGFISLRHFYIRRTLRIFPLYYAVLALYCVLVFATLRGTPKGEEFWMNLPAFLTYTTNWFVNVDDAAGHGVTFYYAWSLATEEQFYLFWPAMLVLLLWLTGRTWTGVLAVTALLALQIAGAGHDKAIFVANVLQSLAPAILFGVMFAILLDHKPTHLRLAPLLGHAATAPAAALAVLACVQFEALSLLTRFVLAVLVAAVCIRENTVLHPFLRAKPLVFLGAISYGVYLLHMLSANVVRKLVGHAFGWDVFLPTVLLTAGVAYVSFRYFESPLLRLKDRIGHGDAATGKAPVAL